MRYSLRILGVIAVSGSDGRGWCIYVNNGKNHEDEDRLDGEVPRSHGGGVAHVHPLVVVGVFLFLMAIMALFVSTLIQMWPATATGVVPLTGSSTATTRWLWWNVTLGRDSQLFVVVAAAGALGSDVHALRSLFRYVGYDPFRYRWMLMYVTLPFTGAALALITYLLLRGGLTSSNSGSGAVNPYGVTAIGALVGLFSDQTIQKLRQVFSTLLAPAEQGKDAISSLEVHSLDPPVGGVGTTVTIWGTGLREVTHVQFGKSRPAAVTSATDVQVAVTVPVDAQTGLVTVMTPDRTKTSTTTFTVIASGIIPGSGVVQVNEVEPPEGAAGTV